MNFSPKKSNIVASALTTVGLILWNSVAHAAMLSYEYTGNYFTAFIEPDYTASNRVTASFLLDDTVFTTPGTCNSLAECGVTDLRISDGFQTLSPLSARYGLVDFRLTWWFDRDRDGHAAPEVWTITIWASAQYITTRRDPFRWGRGLDFGHQHIIYGADSQGEVVDQPGTWNVATIPIPAPKVPIADPNGPYTGDVGELVRFDGSGSYDPDGGDITAYDWDFGDGNVGTEVNPTHIFSTEDDYTVTLIVVDDEGVQSSPAITTTSISPPLGELNIPADQDTFSSGVDPDRNYGSRPLVIVGTSGPAHAFAHFPLDGLGSSVNSAVLKIEVAKVGKPGTIELHQVLSPWKDGALTFNNQPAYDAEPVASISVDSEDEGRTVTVDVTDLVHSWINGSGNYGIAFSSPDWAYLKLSSIDGGRPMQIQLESGGTE